jgi:hypothetical protein
MKHTPGPWEIRGNEIVATTIRPDWADENSDAGERLSVIDLRGALGGLDSVKDANLIAAAPELLEALEDIIEYAQDCASDKGEFPFCIGVAKQVIKKARGEQ